MKDLKNKPAAIIAALLLAVMILTGGCGKVDHGGADYDETYRSPAVEFTDWEEYKDVKADPSKFVNVSITGSGIDIHANSPVKIEKDGTVVMSISSRRDKLQLRSLARFEDRNWMELFNHQGDSARFWNGHSYVYDIFYSSSADNVVQIATNGNVTARKPGETVVTVTCGEFSYEVKIKVVE